MGHLLANREYIILYALLFHKRGIWRILRISSIAHFTNFQISSSHILSRARVINKVEQLLQTSFIMERTFLPLTTKYRHVKGLCDVCIGIRHRSQQVMQKIQNSSQYLLLPSTPSCSGDFSLGTWNNTLLGGKLNTKSCYKTVTMFCIFCNTFTT